jgi:hypothetical protein
MHAVCSIEQSCDADDTLAADPALAGAASTAEHTEARQHDSGAEHKQHMGLGSIFIASVTLTNGGADALRDALLSVVGWVDACILLDTGITDNTVDVAQQVAGDKLLLQKLPWPGSFADARNAALDAAAAAGAQWAILLDTDERIQCSPASSSAKAEGEGDCSGLLSFLRGSSAAMLSMLHSSATYHKVIIGWAGDSRIGAAAHSAGQLGCCLHVIQDSKHAIENAAVGRKARHIMAVDAAAVGKLACTGVSPQQYVEVRASVLFSGELLLLLLPLLQPRIFRMPRAGSFVGRTHEWFALQQGASEHVLQASTVFEVSVWSCTAVRFRYACVPAVCMACIQQLQHHSNARSSRQRKGTCQHGILFMSPVDAAAQYCCKAVP